ncbi:MAG TPA: fibronectin type III domain-containing protein [Pyrinomonadaceae bacterium]|nr:fibronectin type III domain-containing protein [Pyrinomonadaceae bacterium]
MSNKKHRNKRATHTARPVKRKLMVVILIALTAVVCLAGVIAPWSGSIGFKKMLPMQSPSPSPLPLQKEYIYAGDRLLATENVQQVPTTPPAAPTNLTNAKCLRLFRWTDNANNESGFKIELSLDSVSFYLHTTVPANQTFLWNALPRNGANFMRVKAFNAAGDSAPSNVVGTSTKICRTCVCVSGENDPENPDTVWVEDELPAGAVPDGDEPWTWVGTNPFPYSELLYSQSGIFAGPHQHYFHSATQTLTVNAGDWLIAYVYIDPANVPNEIMLQWHAGDSWEHRAYWGQDNIAWGTNGTASRLYMGPLPPAGRWVRLEVPASSVGLSPSVLQGVALTLHGGRANWDYIGKSTQGAWDPNFPAPYNLIADASDATHIALTWSPSAGAHHYRLERCDLLSAGYQIIADNLTNTTHSDLVQSGKAYLYRVQAVNATGTASAYSNRDLAAAVVFTDDPITLNTTLVKGEHVLQLRQAVTGVRGILGLGPPAWADSSLSNVTVQALHIDQLRTNLEPPLITLGLSGYQYTDTSLLGILIKKVHIEELRQRVR